MPELPWVKWFPQDWMSEPGLSLCDVATQGVWANALNAMFLSKQPFIRGTKEQLARLCRCLPQQIEAAVLELRDFSVAIIEWQNDNLTISCRRLLREFNYRELKRQSGILGAASRWHKDIKGMADPSEIGMAKGMARSASASASVPEGECEGGVGLTEEQAVSQCNGPLGIPEDFAKYVFGDWESRGGRDAGNVAVKWPSYIKKRWNREQEEWRQGVHKGQKKSIIPKNINPQNYIT